MNALGFVVAADGVVAVFAMVSGPIMVAKLYSPIVTDIPRVHKTKAEREKKIKNETILCPPLTSTMGHQIHHVPMVLQ